MGKIFEYRAMFHSTYRGHAGIIGFIDRGPSVFCNTEGLDTERLGTMAGAAAREAVVNSFYADVNALRDSTLLGTIRGTKGRVESENLIQALQFLAADPRYYCVFVKGTEAGEQDGRYLSAEAVRKGFTSFVEILAKQLIGQNFGDELIYDIELENFNFKPIIEVSDGENLKPMLTLTENGWVPLEKRV